MVGCSINTVTKLLIDVAKACEAYQDRVMRNQPCERLQVDEVWSFYCSKEKNVPADKRGEFGYGDVWTFVGIDPDTKLVPSWMVGRRDTCNATSFVAGLAARLDRRLQRTTDDHKMYLKAVEPPNCPKRPARHLLH